MTDWDCWCNSDFIGPLDRADAIAADLHGIFHELVSASRLDRFMDWLARRLERFATSRT